MPSPPAPSHCPEPLAAMIRSRMPRALMRLEDRIVLDAAAAGGGDGDTGADHQGSGPLGAPHSADGGDPGIQTADPGSTLTNPTDHADWARDAAEKALASLLGGDAPPLSPRVLLVSSEVAQARLLCDAVAEGVRSVAFDAQSTTLDGLLTQIRMALDGRQAESIALATHAAPESGFELASGATVTLESLSDPTMAAFWTELATLVRPGGRIDLLACDVTADAEGHALVDALERLTGIEFAASADQTGNPSSGGDWQLESDQIDAQATYFTADRLAHFSELLDTPPNLQDSSPSTSAVGGGGPVVVDPNIQLTPGDTGDLEGAAVRVRRDSFVPGQDVLSLNADAIAAAAGAGVAWSYDNATGELLLSGAAPANVYEQILRGVTYENTSATPDTTPRDIFFVIGDAFDSYVYLPSTGHYYEISAGMDTYANALADAAGRDLLGLDGYLVAVKTNEEHILVSGLLPNSPLFQTWAGATDTALEGDWRWETGPEAGSVFWQGGPRPLGFLVAGWYANFPVGEPSGVANRDYLIICSVWDAREWRSATSGEAHRWVIEYGGLATDSEGQLTAQVTVNVIDLNDAPLLDNSGNMSLGAIGEDALDNAGSTVASIIASAGGDRITDADPGAAEGLAIIGVDDAHGTWQFSIDGGATWQDITGVANGNALLLRDIDLIRFQPDANWNGTIDAAISFRAWDQSSGTAGDHVDASTTGGQTAFSSASESASLVVNSVNDAPTVGGPILGQHATEDAPFSCQFDADHFTDVDEGDTLSYSATLADGSPLPDWLSFDPSTRTFSGTPANDDVGTISVKITASDGQGGSAWQVFTIDVANTNDAPLVNAPLPDSSASEDASFAHQFVPNAFRDEDLGDTLSYSATLADGQPLPSWLSFDPLTRTFSGTPANDDVGALEIRVTATDSHGAWVSQVFTLTIVNTNDAPLVAQPLIDQSVTEGTAFVYQIPRLAFHDPDVGDVLTYSATLADGSPLPSWLRFDPATGILSGTPLAGSAGTLQVKVTASDGYGGLVSDVFVLTIAPTGGTGGRGGSGSGGGQFASGGSSSGPGDSTGAAEAGGTDFASDAPSTQAGDAGESADADSSSGSEPGGETGTATGEPGVETHAADGGVAETGAGVAADMGAAAGGAAQAGVSRWSREEEELADATPTDLTAEIADAMFSGNLLDDESQPVEFREAWNTILGAYAGSGEELTVYLQSAFRTVTESAFIDRAAEEALATMREELALAVEAGLNIDVDALLDSVAAARANVRAASAELQATIHAAARAGNQDRFDQVLEDVLHASLERLMVANEQLFVSSQALAAAAFAVRDTRTTGAGEFDAQRLAAAVEQARNQAQSEIAEMRKSWDRVAQDVFAAFVERIVADRAAAAGGAEQF